MKRAGQTLGALYLLLGVFWTGRESSHGLAGGYAGQPEAFARKLREVLDAA